MTIDHTPSSSRKIAHAAVQSALVDAAKAELAASGAAGLSLRAVARAVGLAPSGVYRYFPSRDDLLTALILDAYNALADSVEEAERLNVDASTLDQWRALCTAIRRYALEHPHEYALIYGSPVPGYHAPDETTVAAQRTVLPLLRLIDGRATTTALRRVQGFPAPSKELLAQLTRLDGALPGLSLETMDTALTAWALLFGQIDFEVFGRIGDVLGDQTTLFLHVVDITAWLVGILPDS